MSSSNLFVSICSSSNSQILNPQYSLSTHSEYRQLRKAQREREREKGTETEKTQ